MVERSLIKRDGQSSVAAASAPGELVGQRCGKFFQLPDFIDGRLFSLGKDHVPIRAHEKRPFTPQQQRNDLGEIRQIGRAYPCIV